MRDIDLKSPSSYEGFKIFHSLTSLGDTNLHSGQTMIISVNKWNECLLVLTENISYQSV